MISSHSPCPECDDPCPNCAKLGGEIKWLLHQVDNLRREKERKLPCGHPAVAEPLPPFIRCCNWCIDEKEARRAALKRAAEIAGAHFSKAGAEIAQAIRAEAEK